MDIETLRTYLALLSAAESLGAVIFTGVKALVRTALTPEENQQVLGTWNDNVRRSAINAGLQDPGPTPPAA